MRTSHTAAPAVDANRPAGQSVHAVTEPPLPRGWYFPAGLATQEYTCTDTMAHVPLESRKWNTNHNLFRAQGAHCALLRPMDPGSKHGTRTTVCRLRHWRWSRSRGHTQSTWWRNRRGPSLPRGRADRGQGWRTAGSTSRPSLPTTKQGAWKQQGNNRSRDSRILE